VGGVTPGSDGDSVGGTQNANDRSSPREVFVRPNNIRTKRFVRYNPIISTRSATRSGTYYGLQWLISKILMCSTVRNNK
jgi:hypothetical protein